MFSALPLKPDVAEYGRHVRFVPKSGKFWLWYLRKRRRGFLKSQASRFFVSRPHRVNEGASEKADRILRQIFNLLGVGTGLNYWSSGMWTVEDNRSEDGVVLRADRVPFFETQ